MHDKLKRGEYYPVHGFPGSEFRAKWTGVYRQPLAGEYYLSGSIIEAYKAPNDLPAAYPIARLVRVRKVTKYVEVD